MEIHLSAAFDRSWKFKFWLISLPIHNGAESFLGGTASCRIEVTGIDELYQEYNAAGVLHSLETIVEEQPWGHRHFPPFDLHGN